MGMLLLPLKLPGCYRSYSARTQTFAEGTIATAKYDLELAATAADLLMRASTHTHTHAHTHTRYLVILDVAFDAAVALIFQAVAGSCTTFMVIPLLDFFLHSNNRTRSTIYLALIIMITVTAFDIMMSVIP